MGIARVATVRREGAHLWELAAIHMVHTVQLCCTMLRAAPCCSLWQSASRGIITA
ncbi:MAG: hypothetical protein KatS3mg054_1467 [Chloroflexus sp.]|nr:MAG: hypothetical protein KatS3mg054_1467 [Chloroflexus sp.]